MRSSKMLCGYCVKIRRIFLMKNETYYHYSLCIPLCERHPTNWAKSWRIYLMRIGKGVEHSGTSMRGSIVSSKVDLGVAIHFCRHWRRGWRRYCITLFIVRQVGLWKVWIIRWRSSNDAATVFWIQITCSNVSCLTSRDILYSLKDQLYTSKDASNANYQRTKASLDSREIVTAC